MRRLLAILLGVAALAGAGCGGGSSSSPDPLPEALSFLPRDALFAAVIDTDPGSEQVQDALALVQRFPGGTIALGRLEDQLSSVGLNYERDVKPVLGNPVAVAATGPDNQQAVLAGVAKDPTALDRLLARARSAGFRARGTRAGFAISADRSGDALARKGPTVVAASDVPTLDAALDRHAHKLGLTTDALDQARGDLPDEALVTGYGNVSQLVDTPAGRRAQSVPWLAALRSYAFTIRGDQAGLTFDARLDTSASRLTPAQLPLAAGPDIPAVVSLPGHVTLGLRDPAQVVDFAVAAERATHPARWGRLRAALAQIRDASGVDLRRAVIAPMNQDATLSLDPATREVMFRAGLSTPVATRAALERMQGLVPSLLSGAGLRGASVRSVGGGLWEVRRHGRTVGAYGVTAGQLVAGNVTAADLAVLARRPTKVDPDGGGALSIRVPRAIVAAVAGQVGGIPSELRGLVLGRLGDLHGWASASTLGVRLSLRQDVR